MASSELDQNDTVVSGLSQEEKERIENQEMFRLVVQRQLAEKKKESRGSVFWSVLNNSFSFFLLSSVLLPTTAWVYASREADAKTKAVLEESARARDNRIEKLDSEIAFRFSRALAQLSTANTKRERDQSSQITSVLASLTTRTRGGDMQTLYPEFSNQSALSLMSELRLELIAAGVHSEKMTPTVDHTISRAIKSLSVFSMLDHSEKAPMEVAGALIDIAAATVHDNGARRWNKEFAYTDCSRNQPFC